MGSIRNGTPLFCAVHTLDIVCLHDLETFVKTATVTQYLFWQTSKSDFQNKRAQKYFNIQCSHFINNIFEAPQQGTPLNPVTKKAQKSQSTQHQLVPKSQSREHFFKKFAYFKPNEKKGVQHSPFVIVCIEYGLCDTYTQSPNRTLCP